MTDPVAWDLAERVATRVAGREPLEDSYLYAALQPDFEAELKVVVARKCHDEVPDHLRKRVLRALTEAQDDPTSDGMSLA